MSKETRCYEERFESAQLDKAGFYQRAMRIGGIGFANEICPCDKCMAAFNTEKERVRKANAA